MLSYDGLRAAVDGLELQLGAGSIFALVGPNGAGKTSTLRMLATLTPPTSGTIEISGIDARADPEGVRRKIGYLPDHFALYDQMTPVEYLTFFARLHEVEAKVGRERIESLLEEFDLGDKRGVTIRTLSRGMRQRLGLAKTLVHDPKVLLLDEPASALDPAARLKLRDALLGLRRRGLTIIISSHILPDLADLADGVGIMEGGRMIHSGAIEEVALRAGGGQMIYRVEVCAQFERAREVLATFGPPLRSFIEVAAGQFDVELEGGAELAAALLEKLILSRVRVSHLAPRESALEAVYRASAAAQVT
jgi:ABC-2 type transport system ATP-binding protein